MQNYGSVDLSPSKNPLVYSTVDLRNKQRIERIGSFETFSGNNQRSYFGTFLQLFSILGSQEQH